MIELRDYQIDGQNRIRSAFANGYRRVLYQLPTGGGKTIIFASTARQASAKGKRVMILVHRRELLRQTSVALSNLDVEHGHIRAGAPTNQSKPVMVASVQTLVRRMEQMRWTPDLIIVDECHHAVGGNTWGHVLSYYDKAFILGVSASPARLDGRGLGEMFEHLICGPTTAELTARGYLSPARCFTAATDDTVQTDGVRRRGGDYARDQLDQAANKPRIVGSAVAHYRQLCHQQPAIAFCASVARAERTAQAFRDAGYQSASVDGKLDQRERDKRIADLGNGGLHVLTSADLISEGVDIPVVSAAILLRPTESVVTYLQQVGRALRIHPGKKEALILDHAGNIGKHDLPDADRQWTLDGVSKRKRKDDDEEVKDIALKRCPECYHVDRPTADHKCPICGTEYPVQERKIEEVEGLLREVSRSSLAGQNPEVAARRATSWSRLEQIAEASGVSLDEVIRMAPGQAAKCARTREELTKIQQVMQYKASWVEWRMNSKQNSRAKYQRRTA